MDRRRIQRVAEALREELAEIVGYEMADPRVAGVNVVEVHVSPDLRHAQVMLTAEPGGDEEDVMRALDGARGFLRGELAARLDLQRMPDLHFALETLAGGSRLGHLMRRVRRGRPREVGPPRDEKKPAE